MKLKQLGLLLIGAGLALFINNASAQDPGMEIGIEHLDKGNEYFKQGVFNKAAQEYKIAWEEGDMLDALANLAFLYDFQLNKNEIAIKYYNEYIAADPEYSKIDKFKQLMEKAEQDLKKERQWQQALKDEDSKVKSVQEKYQKIPVPAAPAPPDEEGFNEGLARACLSCHAGFMGPEIDVMATHPVGRVPKGSLAKTVPARVRFYKAGKVICLSCHDPQNIHFEQGTPGRTYKVLRVDTGPEGEDMPRFCAMCHRDKSASRFLEETDEGGEVIRRLQ